MSYNQEKLQRILMRPPPKTQQEFDEGVALLDELIQEAKIEQARTDALLMKTMADRSPDTTPPKGGTNGKTVFTSAAQMLDPDGLGWSLNLPDHLK